MATGYQETTASLPATSAPRSDGFPPIDHARAEEIRNNSESGTKAGRMKLFERLCESRLAEVTAAEARMHKLLEESDKAVAENRKEASRILEVAHSEAKAVYLEAKANAAKILDDANAEARRRISEAAPPPARPAGPEILGDLGKAIFGRMFDTVDKAMELNPDLARKISKTATAVMSAVTGEAPPAGEVADSPAEPAVLQGGSDPYDFTAEETAQSVERLPPALVIEVCKRHKIPERENGMPELEKLTPKAMAELVALFRQQKAAAHG